VLSSSSGVSPIRSITCMGRTPTVARPGRLARGR